VAGDQSESAARVRIRLEPQSQPGASLEAAGLARSVGAVEVIQLDLGAAVACVAADADDAVEEQRHVATDVEAPRRAFRLDHVDVRAEEPADWDWDWYYHLRPFSCVEWVDIDPVDRDHSPPIDHTAEVEAALRRIHVPFSREGQYLRVWGYTRPGSAAVFA